MPAGTLVRTLRFPNATLQSNSRDDRVVCVNCTGHDARTEASGIESELVWELWSGTDACVSGGGQYSDVMHNCPFENIVRTLSCNLNIMRCSAHRVRPAGLQSVVNSSLSDELPTPDQTTGTYKPIR